MVRKSVRTKVAWGSINDAIGRAEIFLNSLDGNGIMLLGLDLGSFPNANRDTQLSIYSGAGNLLFATPQFTVLGSTPSSFTFALFKPGRHQLRSMSGLSSCPVVHRRRPRPIAASSASPATISANVRGSGTGVGITTPNVPDCEEATVCLGTTPDQPFV